uniref:DNA repair protein RAD50 n=1 Tax=Corethrella appendiculata TaxID=1370023 RepID=U5EL78_9DIPT
MSSICKLEIRGVRNFGGDKEDIGTINFFSPLTLIVGANGCGKTTVIECLKYALTGDYPPGTEKGKYFVHDPKISSSMVTMGQVKLMVNNILGDKITCTRSMKVSLQKNNQPRFNTLDSTVEFNKSDGKKVQLNKRVIDVDTEMCEAMGVSKAIINNVIFCHQEDSNWPLDEGKKLKEKFDAIFGTTEYNKVIDRLIKMGKSHGDKMNAQQLQLKDLEHAKAETEKVNLSLNHNEKKLQDLNKTYDEYEQSLVPINKRLEQIREYDLKYREYDAKKFEIQTKIKMCDEQQERLKLKIKNIYSGSLYDLEEEISSFKRNIEMKNDELKTAENEYKSLKESETKLQSQLQKLEQKADSFINQRQQEQDLASERGSHLKDLSRKLSIAINGDLETSNEYFLLIENKVKEELRKSLESIQNLEKNNDDIDHKLQEKIDKLREKKASTESDIQSCSNQIAQHKTERGTTENRVNDIERSADASTQLLKEIEEIDKKFEEKSATVNFDEIKKEISDKKANYEKLQDNFEELDTDIALLTSIAGITTELKLKQKQLDTREIDFKRLQNKHSDSLKTLFNGEMITTNFKRSVQDLYSKFQDQVNQINSTINKLKSTSTEMRITQNNLNEQKNKYEKELKINEQKLLDECAGDEYEDVLAKLKEKIEKNQLEHGASKSAESIYKKYIMKIEENQCCPICHQGMTSDLVSDVNSELSDEIRLLPNKIEQIEKKLKMDRLKHDRLLALQPLAENIPKLKRDLEKLDTQLKETNSKLSRTNRDIEDNEMLIAEPQENLHLVNKISGDMTMLDEIAKEISKLKQDIDNLKKNLPEGMSSESATSLDALQAKRAQLSNELKVERETISKMEKNLSEQTESLAQLRENRNKMKEAEIKIQANLQALPRLKKELEDISKKIQVLEDKKHDNKTSLITIKSQLEDAIQEKSKTRDKNRKTVFDLKKQYDENNKHYSRITDMTKRLNKFSELNLDANIQRLNNEIKNVQEEKQNKTKNIQAKVQQIDSLKKYTYEQSTIERDYQDNRELKKVIKEIDTLKNSYDTLCENIGDLDIKKIDQEKKKLLEDQENFMAKKNQLRGQMNELETTISNLKRLLQKPEYKNALKNYMKKKIEFLVTKKIKENLHKYQNALEFALMKYHGEKMEQINRIICSLWRDIYRGNDIDYIKIKTDEFNEKASTTKRRVFNYRVVQIKGTAEIDMRGRCSAGQKVLASLIIRIALAETFSNNCCVLALDEPTTNLDRQNIGSLCEQLRRIINERENSNFMLLVITHDEEFITALEKFDCYYRLSRNSEGKSIITPEYL